LAGTTLNRHLQICTTI